MLKTKTNQDHLPPTPPKKKRQTQNKKPAHPHKNFGMSYFYELFHCLERIILAKEGKCHIK